MRILEPVPLAFPNVDRPDWEPPWRSQHPWRSQSVVRTSASLGHGRRHLSALRTVGGVARAHVV